MISQTQNKLEEKGSFTENMSKYFIRNIVKIIDSYKNK